MEQYSKEFWQTCIDMHPMHLSKDVGDACVQHNEWVLKWLDGEELERSERKDVWGPVPKTHHRFMRQYKYRVTPPKPIERDVVVYWRGALRNQPFHMSACIDVRLLCPPGTNEKAKTLAQLEEETPGFKLLSITRVVVDPTNHNLMEYTTKLDNLGRVPF